MTEPRPVSSDPPLTDSGDLPAGDLPAPGTPEPSQSGLVEATPRAPGRVDAAEAVTGDRPTGDGAGQAAPSGVPGDDGSLED